MSEYFLGNHGVCRVHGGGFAGTIQAFVTTDFVPEYKKQIEKINSLNYFNVYFDVFFNGTDDWVTTT